MSLHYGQDERKKFYCREWAFQKLGHCLDQRPASKTCGALLLGGPGCGKTTLCTELAHPSPGPTARQQRSLNRRLLAHHFLHGHSEQTLSLSAFIRSLVTQILNHSTESHREKNARRNYNTNISYETNLNLNSCPQELNLPQNARTVIADAYLAKLQADEEIQSALRAKNIELNPDDCLKRALLFPLLEIDPPKQSLFILIDSIDEHGFVCANSTLTRPKQRTQTSQNSRSIAELLANHHHLFPQWLLLVCTARKQSKSIARMFTGFRKLSLDDLRKSHVVRDVQQYILARLDQETTLRQHISRDTAEMLNQLHIKSNGCFLYLEKVLDGVAECFIVLREVREIPGTLNGLYLWLCQRLFTRRQFAKVQPLLNILLAAREEVVDEGVLWEVMRIAKVTRADFNKRFHLLRRVVVVTSTRPPSTTGHLRLFHHSFAEWLLDVKHCTQKYLCNIYEGHAMLAAYYTLHAKSLNNREIYDFGFHLTRVEQYLVSERQRLKGKNCGGKVMAVEKKNEKDYVVDGDGLATMEKSATEIYSDLKALEEVHKLEADLAHLHIHHSDSEPETKNHHLLHHELSTSPPLQNHPAAPEIATDDNFPIYAQVKKKSTKNKKQHLVEDDLVTLDASTQQQQLLDPHSLVLLWVILSGAPVEDSLLDSNEISGVNFGAFLPTDAKVLKLLLDAGASENPQPMHNDEQMFDENASCSSSTNSNSSPTLFPSDAATLYALHGPSALHVASRLGQTHAVAVLLSTNSSCIDQQDSDGWTPLRAAAWGGHTSVVRLLVSHGCSLDAPDAENRTALRAASWSGHDEIVRILLQHGANPNLTDDEGRTALIAGAYMSHAEIVELLLDYGAEVDHADADGRTALSVAALCAPRTAGVRVVQTLIERGADVDRRDKEGMTPLLVAAFEGHKDVCELLLENEADVDHCDSTGRSPLWAAASMGHAPVVALLLFWGCCIDAMDAEGRTVLSVAAAQGCVDVVRQLLDRGLDEQHRDNSGWTPLHYAAFEGHREVCEALLEAGARVDETDNEGKAALALAAQGGHTALVGMLLDKYGAPYDQRPHDGKTALRLAALEGHYDIVHILLTHGADVNLKDADGRSTLYVLALDNRLAMAKYFLQQGGADVETRDLEGRTPLHVSAWQGHTEMVALLLQVGRACVDAPDAENRTALHSASWQGHSAIVDLLLSAGSHPDHACNQGATALGIAAQEGHDACVISLLAHGADPSHSDACGRNALRVAAKSGHRSVVRLLEEFASGTGGGLGGNNAVNDDDNGGFVDGGGAGERRSMVSLGNHSSNSTKSSSNRTTTGSSQSSRHGEARSSEKVSGGGGGLMGMPAQVQQQQQPALSFTQQLQQCTRGAKTRPLSKLLLSPLRSEPHSPIYASPPLSPVHDPDVLNIYQPVLLRQQQQQQITTSNKFTAASPASGADPHFARDTHMRIILGNSSALTASSQPSSQNKHSHENNSSSKPKRNGIVTNPALRLVANVKNGLDTAAANLRKSTSGGNNSATKTNSFHWRKETPL